MTPETRDSICAFLSAIIDLASMIRKELEGQDHRIIIAESLQKEQSQRALNSH